MKTADRSRAESEIALFSEQYPDTDLDSVPDRVWESVKEGVSLCDAYRRYDDERRSRQDAARAVNEENAAESSGRIRPSAKRAVYTASDVAAMTAAEVRDNYDDIITSMDSKGFYT
ncbi:MAG: hypothetical protein J5585_11595 [Clostridia bacterium]|nr:hypothetical protein [Clostridia bacterium]